MKLYEYEAKSIFSSYGIPIPSGQEVTTPSQAKEVAEELGGKVVLKAQILVGGRGKAGGIKFAENPEQAEKVAEELFSLSIKGLPVETLLVEEMLEIKRELYLGLTIDRGRGQSVLMMSSEGGVDIEEVAERDPEKIVTYHLNPLQRFYPFQAREILQRLGFHGKLINPLSQILLKLSRVFQERDAEIAEINPLVLTPEGVIAADAKLIVDDDALFRQKAFQVQEEDLPYVELEGHVGCIVNGAGLAMSTMDTLKELGGEPANFLDIGGGASAEVMEMALKRVVLHSGVKVILINILGGITRCDEIAKGILKVLGDMEVPVVVRLRGTNEEEGLKLLSDAGVNVESSMIKAAQSAIALGREGSD